MSAERPRNGEIHLTSAENEVKPESFGEVLKELRDEKGCSQLALARLAELDHSYVSRLEGGERHPSTDVVERLIGVLGADETQADRLRASAGFKGKNNTISHEEQEMLEVNMIFNNPQTPPEVKAALRNVLSVALGRVSLGRPLMNES